MSDGRDRGQGGWADERGPGRPPGHPGYPIDDDLFTPGGHAENDPPPAGRVVPGRAERSSGPVQPGRANRNLSRVTGRLTRSNPVRGTPPPPGPPPPPSPRQRGAPVPGRDPAAPAWRPAEDPSGPPEQARGADPGAPQASRPDPTVPPVTPGRASRHAARQAGWGRSDRSGRGAPDGAGQGWSDGARGARDRAGGTGREARGGAPPPQAPGRTRPRPAVGSRKGVWARLALAAGLVAAAGALVGVAQVLPAAKTPAPPAAAAPYAGRWVCPTLPRLAGTVTVTNVGAAPARLRSAASAAQATVVGGGQTRRGGPTTGTLAPGGTRKLSLKPSADAGFVQVEAFGAPIAVAAGGQPPCAPGPGDRWWLPGLTSSNTARADVVLANPDSVDATVAITPHLTEGSIHPVGLQNIFVRAGTAVVKTIDVPDVQTLPFTAEVVATSGRVVAGALVTSRVGKQTRQTLVPGQPSLRSSWVFTGGLTPTANDVEALIANPNQGELTVVADATTDQGTFKAPGFDLPIPDGAIAQIRVPLNPGKTGAFSLRIRSKDGAKFVAALRFNVAGGRAGGYFETGGSLDDARWLLPQAPASRKLVFANVSGEPVTAQLSRLAAAGAAGGGPVGSITVAPGKVGLRAVPANVQSLLIVASGPGLVAAPLGGGQVVPGSQVGGLPVEGPVLPGPAAAP
ncbi:MAG TPA: hypothetical protein VG276_05325 [Actinomycetes bacterium]|nr:hypothetical protein [Actinomycetes bacterium]